MTATLLALALAPALAADTTWIYETEGADTVAAELYWTVGDGVRGHIVVRRPEVREVTYTIRVGDEGLPDRVTLEWRRHAEEGTEIEASFTATIENGRMLVSDPSGERVGEYPSPAASVPMTGRRPIAYGMLEMLARATPADGERTVHLLLAGQPDPVEATLTRTGETFRLETPALRIEAVLENGSLAAVTSRLISGGSLRTYQAQQTTRFRPETFLRPTT